MTVTAKSVIFDIADVVVAEGATQTYMGIDGISFFLNRLELPITSANFTAYATSTYTGRDVNNIFDVLYDKTDPNVSNTGWISDIVITNQRVAVVFDTPQTFSDIQITNCSFQPVNGAGNVKITISDDAIVDTTYNAVIANSTVLNDTTWPQHESNGYADWVTVYGDISFLVRSPYRLITSALSLGDNWRFRIPPAMFNDTLLPRLKVAFNRTCAYTIHECWIGVSGGGTGVNFDGTQEQIFFAGAASIDVTASDSEYILSDPVNIDLSTAADGLVIAIYVSTEDYPYDEEGSGFSTYYKSVGSSDAAITAQPSSYTYSSDSAYLAGVLQEYEGINIVGALGLSGDITTAQTSQLELSGAIGLSGSCRIYSGGNDMEIVGNLGLSGSVETYRNTEFITMTGSIGLSGQVIIAEIENTIVGGLGLSGSVTVLNNVPVSIAGKIGLSGHADIILANQNLELVGQLGLFGSINVLNGEQSNCELPAHNIGRWS